MEPSERRGGGGRRGRPADAAPAKATVNFKEFLQDIFINFFFLVVFGKGLWGWGEPLGQG